MPIFKTCNPRHKYVVKATKTVFFEEDKSERLDVNVTGKKQKRKNVTQLKHQKQRKICIQKAGRCLFRMFREGESITQCQAVKVGLLQRCFPCSHGGRGFASLPIDSSGHSINGPAL